MHEIGIYGKQTSCYFQALGKANTLKDNLCYNGPRAGINWNDGFAGGSTVIVGKTASFFEFPYVCPEPVLAKRSFLYINGAKMPFFAGQSGIQYGPRDGAKNAALF
jgi:hypothetical protein